MSLASIRVYVFQIQNRFRFVRRPQRFCGKREVVRFARQEVATNLSFFTPEERCLIETLRARHQLLETDDEQATVPNGVTHILLVKQGQKPELICIEQRK